MSEAEKTPAVFCAQHPEGRTGKRQRVSFPHAWAKETGTVSSHGFRTVTQTSAAVGLSNLTEIALPAGVTPEEAARVDSIA